MSTGGTESAAYMWQDYVFDSYSPHLRRKKFVMMFIMESDRFCVSYVRSTFGIL